MYYCRVELAVDEIFKSMIPSKHWPIGTVQARYYFVQALVQLHMGYKYSLNCIQTAVSCTHPVLCLYIIYIGRVRFVYRVSKGKLKVFCYYLILSDTFLSISRVQNHYKICSITILHLNSSQDPKISPV